MNDLLKMSLSDKKEYIKNFIYKTMDDYSYERAEELGNDLNDWNFKSYDHFCKYNSKKVDKSKKKFINWLIQLSYMISQNKIGNMDKESMVVFNSSGFCWDKNGRFVIFNEQ